MSDKPLQHLSAFCLKELDLRSIEHKEKLKLVMHELPALWPNLLEILNLQKSNFLPNDVAQVVLKLIEIRRATFVNAAERQDDDYIPWSSIGEEHPTQFYPNWDIFRHPKKYDVSNTIDSDFCDKVTISKTKKHLYGKMYSRLLTRPETFLMGCSVLVAVVR